jgi:hypothetical protein
MPLVKELNQAEGRTCKLPAPEPYCWLLHTVCSSDNVTAAFVFSYGLHSYVRVPHHPTWNYLVWILSILLRADYVQNKTALSETVDRLWMLLEDLGARLDCETAGYSLRLLVWEDRFNTKVQSANTEINRCHFRHFQPSRWTCGAQNILDTEMTVSLVIILAAGQSFLRRQQVLKKFSTFSGSQRRVTVLHDLTTASCPGLMNPSLDSHIKFL